MEKKLNLSYIQHLLYQKTWLVSLKKVSEVVQLRAKERAEFLIFCDFIKNGIYDTRWGRN